MTRCLTDSDFHRYHAKEMDEAEAAGVRAHFEGCSSCAERSAKLVAVQKGLIQELQKADLGEPDATASVERKKVEPTNHPERIGAYKILEQLGEGGMGTVYLAEQTAPIRRRVALKLIKLGMDTKQVIARFETERQALALMNHPNVAKVLDAGTSEKGRPYFVMEYVKGESITAYCDRHRLTTKERLGLFMQVCQAVQHAHQKAIIHRDIKPSNVLVAVEGDRPVPKVIDFGVAKAIEHKLTERTLFTEQGQLIGTPEYMSPEQAEMTVLDIDTRTDIYSLGVLLYELLVGALPFEPTSLRQAGFAEIQRIIREEEPPKPSTRLSSMGDDSTTAAHKRRTDQKALQRQLRGDLDWITMRAMDKDRTRRYATASEFADDIARHLNHEPVLASPPSAAYRARKFIRRNKGPVAIAAVFVLLISASAVGFGVLYNRADQARQSEADQRALAEEQTRIAQAVNDFLNNDLLAAVAPEQQGKDVLMRDVLDTASQAIAGKFDDAPLIEASIRSTLGNTYHKLGDYSKAEPHLVRALEIRRAQLGAEHEDTLVWTGFLALLYVDQGRFDQAEPLLSKTLALSRRVLGEEHPYTLSSMHNLAVLYDSQGRFDEAEPLYERALESKRSLLGEEHPNTLGSMNNLAFIYLRQGRYDEAESLYVKTMESMRRVIGEEHPRTLGSMVNLATVYWRQGRFDDAETLFIKTLELQRSLLGEEHPYTLTSMNNLANLYLQQGRFDEAEQLYLKTLELRRRVLGEEHPHTLSLMNNLASLYSTQGRFDEAEPLSVKVLELSRRLLGEEHPDTLNSMSNLALLYSRQGRYDEAEPLYLKTLELRRRVPGEEHPDTLSSTNNLAVLYKNQGRYDEAEPLYVKTLELRRRVLGEEHPDTLGSIGNLANLYSNLGRFDEAEPLYLKTLELTRRVLGEEHPYTLGSMYSLASLYYRQGRFDEAGPLHVKTLELRRRVLGEEHPNTLSSMVGLALLYKKQGRFDEAEPLHVKTLELRRRVLGEEHPYTLSSMNNLASLYLQQGRFDEAEPLNVKTLELRRRVLGEEHPHTLLSMNNLAYLYYKQGRFDETEPLYLKTLELRRRVLGEEHPDTLGSMSNLARLLLTCEPADLRDPVKALEFATKAVEASNEQNPTRLDTLALAQQMNGDIDAAIETQTKAVALLPPGPSALRSELESNLVKYLLEGQRFAKAEPLLLAMHDQIVGSSDESPSQTQASIERLAKFYESWHAAEPGQGYDAKAAEWRAKLPRPAGEPDEPTR